MSDRIAGAQLFAEAIAEGAALVRRLLGTADATEVEAVVGDVCLRALGAPPGAHELCRASVGVVFGLRLADGRRVARGELWPPPHDVRFDFGATAAGAEWIDALRACALAVTRRDGDAPVVGHGDWRREHLRIRDGRLAAIYDWDSVHVASESAIAAGAMRCYPAD